jgi:hypothetical protein
MKITKEEKDTWAVISALAMLFFGMMLTIAGFIIPPSGEVHDSVLYILAQCLFYAGGIFGITLYTRRRLDDIEHKLRDRHMLDDDEEEQSEVEQA